MKYFLSCPKYYLCKSQNIFIHVCFLTIFNFNKPALGLLLQSDRDDMGFPCQDTASWLITTLDWLSLKWMKGIDNTPFLSLPLSDVWAPDLDSPSGGLKWRSDPKFKTPSRWTQRERTLFLERVYSHFTVLLEDAVCLFRIYVHQSGDKGLSIAQTDRGNQLAC